MSLSNPIIKYAQGRESFYFKIRDLEAGAWAHRFYFPEELECKKAEYRIKSGNRRFRNDLVRCKKEKIIYKHQR